MAERHWRPLAGLLPASLLAGAVAALTATTVAAAPCPPSPRGTHHGCTAATTHTVRHTGRHHHHSSPPAPVAAPAPVAVTTATANTQPQLGVIVETAANLIAPISRAVEIPAAAPSAIRPTLGGGVLSVPQTTLPGGGSLNDIASDAGVWQVVAGAEGLAVLALVAALARRRRTSPGPGR